MLKVTLWNKAALKRWIVTDSR